MKLRLDMNISSGPITHTVCCLHSEQEEMLKVWLQYNKNKVGVFVLYNDLNPSICPMLRTLFQNLFLCTVHSWSRFDHLGCPHGLQSFDKLCHSSQIMEKSKKTKNKKLSKSSGTQGINHSLNLYVGFLGGSHSKGNCLQCKRLGLSDP